MSKKLAASIAVFLLAISVGAYGQTRARDLGIPFDGSPGPLNAITDVSGVEVGQVTLIEGRRGACRWQRTRAHRSNVHSSARQGID